METRAALVGMVDNVQLGLGTTTRLQTVRSSIRIPAVDIFQFSETSTQPPIQWVPGYLPSRGELSYLAPLGSENISAPYFKQSFFQGGGGITPQTVKHHASQSQDRNNKYFILYIEFVAADLLFRLARMRHA